VAVNHGRAGRRQSCQDRVHPLRFRLTHSHAPSSLLHCPPPPQPKLRSSPGVQRQSSFGPQLRSALPHTALHASPNNNNDSNPPAHCARRRECGMRKYRKRPVFASLSVGHRSIFLKIFPFHRLLQFLQPPPGPNTCKHSLAVHNPVKEKGKQKRKENRCSAFSTIIRTTNYYCYFLLSRLLASITTKYSSQPHPVQVSGTAGTILSSPVSNGPSNWLPEPTY